MSHKWKKVYHLEYPGAHPTPTGIERCTCGALRLKQDEGKYSYFKPGWTSPEEPPCEDAE